MIAIVLAIEMKSLLIGEAASEQDEAAIIAAIVGADSVQELIDLRTEHIGPETILVAAKVEFDDGLTMRELADVVDAVEARRARGGSRRGADLRRTRRRPPDDRHLRRR